MTYQEASKLIDGFSSVYKGGQLSRETLEEIINSLQKIDTQKHAHWTEEIEESLPHMTFYRCSNCNKCEGWNRIPFDFCPNCGAKMDEEAVE